MVIEQAFFNLPEILVGSGYPTQDYEGGIVAAFSLAVLQELNSRNANNPIGHMIAERLFQVDRIDPKKNSGKKYLYETAPFKDAKGKNRFLRADLHVDLANLRVATKALGSYGFRYSNWIEAKFFRDSYAKGSSLKSVYTGLMAADLLRLMALPPIEYFDRKRKRREIGDQERMTARGFDGKHEGLYTGRYLLHLYQGNPKNYLAVRRNKKGSIPGATRNWVKALMQPGQQSIVTLDLKNEVNTFLGPLNKELSKVDCKAVVTNFIIRPTHDDKVEDAYWCILTRIDSFTITLDGKHSWSVTANRTAAGKKPADLAKIREHIGNYVHGKEKVEAETPKSSDANTELSAETMAQGASAASLIIEDDDQPLGVDKKP